MRISDWSSDVCSPDLDLDHRLPRISVEPGGRPRLWRGRHPLSRARRRRLSPVPHLHAGIAPAGRSLRQIGRASCRERVCQYVEISWVAVPLKKEYKTTTL